MSSDSIGIPDNLGRALDETTQFSTSIIFLCFYWIELLIHGFTFTLYMNVYLVRAYDLAVFLHDRLHLNEFDLLLYGRKISVDTLIRHESSVRLCADHFRALNWNAVMHMLNGNIVRFYYNRFKYCDFADEHAVLLEYGGDFLYLEINESHQLSHTEFYELLHEHGLYFNNHFVLQSDQPLADLDGYILPGDSLSFDCSDQEYDEGLLDSWNSFITHLTPTRNLLGFTREERNALMHAINGNIKIKKGVKKNVGLKKQKPTYRKVTPEDDRKTEKVKNGGGKPVLKDKTKHRKHKLDTLKTAPAKNDKFEPKVVVVEAGAEFAGLPLTGQAEMLQGLEYWLEPGISTQVRTQPHGNPSKSQTRTLVLHGKTVKFVFKYEDDGWFKEAFRTEKNARFALDKYLSTVPQEKPDMVLSIVKDEQTITYDLKTDKVSHEPVIVSDKIDSKTILEEVKTQVVDATKKVQQKAAVIQTQLVNFLTAQPFANPPTTPNTLFYRYVDKNMLTAGGSAGLNMFRIHFAECKWNEPYFLLYKFFIFIIIALIQNNLRMLLLALVMRCLPILLCLYAFNKIRTLNYSYTEIPLLILTVTFTIILVNLDVFLRVTLFFLYYLEPFDELISFFIYFSYAILSFLMKRPFFVSHADVIRTRITKIDYSQTLLMVNNPLFDFRRAFDTNFAISLNEAHIPVESTYQSHVIYYGHDYYGDVLNDPTSAVIYETATTDKFMVSLQLVYQILCPKNNALTISPEALIERMGNSTNLGPMIGYNKQDELDLDVVNGSAKLAIDISLCHRYMTKETDIFDRHFRIADRIRLGPVPPGMQPVLH